MFLWIHEPSFFNFLRLKPFLLVYLTVSSKKGFVGVRCWSSVHRWMFRGEMLTTKTRFQRWTCSCYHPQLLHKGWLQKMMQNQSSGYPIAPLKLDGQSDAYFGPLTQIDCATLAIYFYIGVQPRTLVIFSFVCPPRRYFPHTCRWLQPLRSMELHKQLLLNVWLACFHPQNSLKQKT